MAPDLSKFSFIVTDTAGPKVGSRAVKPGDTLLLTEFEARSELLAGVIRPATETEAVAQVPADDAAAGASDKPARRR